MAAGVALFNPDNPARPVNSPKTVYQIGPGTLKLLRTFGTVAWIKNLAALPEKQEDANNEIRESARDAETAG